MKKITALFLLLVFMLCGCNQPNVDKVSSPQKQQIQKNSSQNLTDSSNIIDISSKTKSTTPLSEEEVKDIFEPLLKKAIEVQETILNDGSEYKILNQTPYVINEINYYLIEHSEFKSIDDVWNYAYTAYTKEAAKRIFSKGLDPNEVAPRFIEKNGYLYYQNSAHGRAVKYPIDSLSIIEQYEDTIIVSIDFCSYDYEPEKSVYVICYTESGWKICNSEDEALYILPKQFLK